MLCASNGGVIPAVTYASVQTFLPTTMLAVPSPCLACTACSVPAEGGVMTVVASANLLLLHDLIAPYIHLGILMLILPSPRLALRVLCQWVKPVPSA